MGKSQINAIPSKQTLWRKKREEKWREIDEINGENKGGRKRNRRRGEKEGGKDEGLRIG